MTSRDSAGPGAALPTPRFPAAIVGGGVNTSVPGERHLLAAIERVARAPQGWSAIALHLSRLMPPAPRAHHRRIARAMLQDAAQRGDGQVFSLRNGDVVLLARDPTHPADAVSDRLRQLFGREAGDTARLVSQWELPEASPELLAYTAERLREPENATTAETSHPPAETVDAVAAAIAGARPHDIIHRQVGVQLDPAGASGGAGIRALFRELTFSLDVLETRLPAAMRPGQDKALLLHLGRYLDQRMLQILRLDRGSTTPLDLGANSNLTLHLNLSLPGVLSNAFAIFSEDCRAVGRPLGIEISLVEAVADPVAFAKAAARLQQVGARLVIDGMSHLALLVARPALLGADLMKLEWSPRISELPADDQSALAAAVADAGPGKMILQRAETEAAVRWGLVNGIRLFQGRYIDQMLAVQRMVACPMASACTLRQCVERATATGGAGRASCTNLPLLDAGLPPTLDPLVRPAATARP
jgi:hypothetical protein